MIHYDAEVSPIMNSTYLPTTTTNVQHTEFKKFNLFAVTTKG